MSIEFDPEDLHVENRPTTWKEYVHQMIHGYRIYGWIWEEMIPSEAKQRSKTVLWALVLWTIFSMGQPYAVGMISDAGIRGDTRQLVYGFTLLVFLIMVKTSFEWTQHEAKEWIYGLNRLRVDIACLKSLLGKSLEQHVRENKLLSIGNIERGRTRLYQAVDEILSQALGLLTSLFISFLFLLWVSPFAGVVMAILFIGYLFIGIWLNQKVSYVCDPIERDFRDINRRFVHVLERIQRVKTSGKEREEIEGMEARLIRVWDQDRDFWTWFLDVIVRRRGMLNRLAFLLIMGYVILQAWQGQLGWGQLIPIYVWTNQVSDNLWRVQDVEKHLSQCLPSIFSLHRALNIPSIILDKEEAVVLPRHSSITLSFEMVGHAYSDTQLEELGRIRTNGPPAVLKNISFSLLPGEKVALIGPSGAGKSTLMKLLLRFMDPDKGIIRVNGHDLRDIQLFSWLQCVGYIPQQSEVMDGSLRDNLLYGLSKEECLEVTDEELWRIMRLLQIDFGARLTKGLDTQVGRNGLQLSGGQAQRLMIGAAVLKRPKFMLIDEATASLDSSTERLVHDGLKTVLGDDIGAFIIAHRLSTVRDLCDRFIVLRPADAVREGESQIEASASSFEELYAISPIFRRLADDQHLIITTK